MRMTDGETTPKIEVFIGHKIAAENGIADAQNILGVMYFFGDGVEQNKKTALKWYKLAAEQEHPQAQYNLGCIYPSHFNLQIYQPNFTSLTA